MTSRRDFLRFLGYGATLPWGALGSASGCMAVRSPGRGSYVNASSLLSIAPTRDDDVVLAPGLTYDVVIRDEALLTPSGERFGVCPDFIAWLPRPEGGSATDGLLWVNHEYPLPVLLHRLPPGQAKTRAQIEREQRGVGGSVLAVTQRGDRWYAQAPHALNRRITGQTKIPLVAERSIVGQRHAWGTLGNCSGGVTPWGTVLTCEENYDNYYGETVYVKGRPQRQYTGNDDLGWHTVVDRPPEHYGWVVEVNPFTGAARKLVALGRFAHESATVAVATDGRCVVYSGDDMKFGCLYKFIAARPGTLTEGTLYVANMEAKQWEALTLARPELRDRFADTTEMLIRTREAALRVGGSRLDRPEDIEINPKNNDVLVAFTNNQARGNDHGAVVKLIESNQDFLSMSFDFETLVAGGPETGLSCPDNLCFDRAGNLWITNDITGTDMNRESYRSFGNNGLFVVPVHGPRAGEVIRLGSAPRDAEFTGPCFTPDGETLFVSVQHPGERSTPEAYTSHWPDGGDAAPQSAVIAIRGPLLSSLSGRVSSGPV